MKYNINKKNAFYLLGGILWTVVLLIILGVKGYQPVQCKKITEQEMFEITVQRAIDTMFSVSFGFGIRDEGINIDTGEHLFSRKREYLPYHSVAHFLEVNPDCCSVKTYENWLAQSDGSWVSANGKGFYLGQEGEILFDRNISYSLFFPTCVRYYP